MKPFDYFLYAIVVFGWSTSWLPLKWQLGVVAPEVSLVWRFAIAAVLMFAVTALLRQRIWVPLRYHLRPASIGLFLFCLNFTLFYYAGLNVTSGLLAVVFALASGTILLLDALTSRRLPQRAHVIASLVGFSGVAMLYTHELQSVTFNQGALLSLIFCLIGTLSFSLGNIVSASSQRQGLTVMSVNCWGMVYGTAYLTIWSLIRGHDFIIEETALYIGSLLWLAIISSVATFTAYLMLVGRIGAPQAGYATAVFPIFALMLSSLVEGYQWSALAFAGLALVVIGNLLIVQKPSR